MNKIKNVSQKKGLVITALVIAIVICLFRITWIFANEKDGHHSDESWSYGFACSYYEPYDYIYVNEDIYLSDATDKYVNEWVNGEDFWNYLTIQEDERFSFDSVVYNKSGDNSPPLFEILLNFVCSLFPNTFSWWYGYCINILSFIGICVLLFATTRLLSGSKWLGVATVLFYGFSIVGLSSTIYLRMYSLLTLFTLLLVYLVVRVFKKNYRKCTLEYILIGLDMILGGLTHFYFLVFAFLFSAFFCIGLMVSKEWKALIKYAVSAVLGVVVYFVLYPYSIYKMISGTSMYDGTIQFKYLWYLRTTLSIFLTETLGFSISISLEAWLWFVFALVVIIVTFVLLSFVFRKDQWYKDFLACTKGKIVSTWKKLVLAFKSKESIIWISLWLTVLGVLLVVTKISNVQAMGLATDRYMFNDLCVFIMLFVCFLYGILRRIFAKKQIWAGIIFVAFSVFFLLLQNFHFESEYLFSAEKRTVKELTEELDSKNVILVGNAPWRLVWYAVMLMKANRVLYVNTDDDNLNLAELMKELPENEDALLLLEKSSYIPKDKVLGEGESTAFELSVNDLQLIYTAQTENELMSILDEASERLKNREFLFVEPNTFVGDIEFYSIR